MSERKPGFRSIWVGVLLALCCVGPALGQMDGSLESYFTGKEVGLKLDMPGSQKGVDLKFNKPVAMDWNDYSSRIKSYGVAIRKGDVVRVTKFVVKSDMIEFQLAGGGFGTAGDDSNTIVSATPVPKSQYERDLEKQISATTDDKKRRDLQQDLDRERSRRERLDAANQNNAKIASQIKAQQVADKRLGGGSRFNLRWQGSIPSDSRNPEAVMRLLADYVDFNPGVGGAGSDAVAAAPAAPAANGDAGSGALQLKRGLTVDEVAKLMGQGLVLSNTVSSDGLKTQVMRYKTTDTQVDVTFVEGVVVRYSINSL